MTRADDLLYLKAIAFENLGIGCALWGSDGCLTICNSIFAAYFGSVPTALIGHERSAILGFGLQHGTIVRSYQIGSSEKLSDLAPGFAGAEFTCADGSILAAQASPISDELIITLLQDVTDIRRGATDLIRARDQATASDQSKSRFLRAANHDLRQPLASLKILIYSCLRAESNDERDQTLHAMDVAVSIMEDLLGALLNIGQLDAGKIEPTIAAFQIEAIFSRLRLQYAHQAREKGLDLRVLSSNLTIVSDRVLLERILSNFLGNAIRYTNVGRVIVGCRRRGDHLRILVADTGIGIASDHTESIFEEFFRIDDSHLANRHSLGLGLNIARRFADILGHSIGVKSIFGRGSCFYVDVPVGNIWHSTIGEPEISERIGGEFSGICCLLLEDDRSLRDAFTILLERWGMDVITLDDFSNASKAILTLERKPDFILTDYRLRGSINGPDLVSEINDILEKPCPALVMTAETGPNIIKTIRELGFPVLIKPVSPSALRVLMHNLLFEPELVPELR